MPELCYKNFVKLSLPEKKLVLEWRNADRVRLRMDSQEVIALEDHLRWIESLKGRTDCVHSLVLLDSTPIGVANHHLEVIDGEQQIIGGMYIGDERFSGYGVPLLYYGLFYNFEKMNMSCLRSEIRKSNKRVYLMHKKIFHTKDLGEDDTHYHIQYDREVWGKVHDELDEQMRTVFGITHVNWNA